MKFIFNFLDEHWNSGNRFVVEIESTRAVCTNCQGYLGYLKRVAAKHGKTIEYKVISNLKTKTFKQIDKVTN